MKYIIVMIAVLAIMSGCSQRPLNGSNFRLNLSRGICIDTVSRATDILIYSDSIVFSKNSEFDFSYIFFINNTPLFMKNRRMPAENQYELISDKQYRNTLKDELDRCLLLYDDSINDFIIVSVAYQQMLISDREGNIRNIFPVSTSGYGIGNTINSNQTPLGAHIIRYMTGANVPSGGIFRYRQYTGETADIYTDMTDTENDYITTRIMHLGGIEQGINKGGNVDSYERHIYIHGTHEEGRIGIPSSHGCIRMLNEDVIELYQMAYEGMPVIIVK